MIGDIGKPGPARAHTMTWNGPTSFVKLWGFIFLWKKDRERQILFWMTWLLFHFFWESTGTHLFIVYAICNFVMFVFRFFLIWLLLFISTPDVISTGHKGPMPAAPLAHVTWALGFGPSSVLLSCVWSMSCRTTQYLDKEVAWNWDLRKLIETCNFFMIENPKSTRR